jgi:hypothetical protein
VLKRVVAEEIAKQLSAINRTKSKKVKSQKLSIKKKKKREKTTTTDKLLKFHNLPKNWGLRSKASRKKAFLLRMEIFGGTYMRRW